MHSKFRKWSRKIRQIVVVALTSLSLAAALAQNDSTDLNKKIKLLGAITAKSGTSVALVKELESGTIKAIRTGSDVFGFGKLVNVDRLKMDIERSGGDVITVRSRLGMRMCKITGCAVGAKTIEGDVFREEGLLREGNKITVDRRYRDQIIKNELPTVLMQAASEPVMGANGNIEGFRLFELAEGSMFHKLGIKDGDIVTEINGFPLDNAVRTVQFLNSLKNADAAQVRVRRGDQEITLDMNVQ